MNKKEIRSFLKKKRSELSKIEKEKMDNELYKKFIDSRYYEMSKCIFIYINMDNEIDTKHSITKALNDNKRVVVPKVDIEKKIMRAVEIFNMNDLVKVDPFGILEPKTFRNEVSKEEIDLVIVPGLAFDRNGGRLGYGGGYYDKFLQDLSNVKKIALAYEFQILEKIPMDEHDIFIDDLIY